LTDFAVYTIATNEDVATERGAVFTQHNDLLDVTIDSSDALGYPNLRLVFEALVQDAEKDLAAEEGSRVVEAG
jgi:hypothetical protein